MILANITSRLTGYLFQLLKPKKIRMGNWEAKVLSKEQLHYAATDAFASWFLYEVRSPKERNGSSLTQFFYSFTQVKFSIYGSFIGLEKLS